MNASEKGEPKSLNEAIKRALYVGPLMDVEQRLQNAVREFIASRMIVAVDQARLVGPLEEKHVLELYNELMGEPCGKE